MLRRGLLRLAFSALPSCTHQTVTFLHRPMSSASPPASGRGEKPERKKPDSKAQAVPKGKKTPKPPADYATEFDKAFSTCTHEYIDSHCHIDLILERLNGGTKVGVFADLQAQPTVAAAGGSEHADSGDCCAPRAAPAAAAASPETGTPEAAAAAWTWARLAGEYIKGNCPAVVTVCCDIEAQAPVLALLDKDIADAKEAAPAPAGAAAGEAASRRSPTIWAAFGLHPHNAKYWTDDVAAALEAAMAHPRVVAWGECGLDYFYDSSPRDQQRSAFVAQMKLAVKHGKPLVVHSREAEEDTLALMTQTMPKDWKIHLHCCTSSVKLVTPLLEHFPNLKVGFTGCITFPTADSVRDTLRNVPLDRLLLETDGPFMAPVPLRSLPAHPGMILFTAQKMADVKGVSIGELLAQVRKNTTAVYGI